MDIMDTGFERDIVPEEAGDEEKSSAGMLVFASSAAVLALVAAVSQGVRDNLVLQDVEQNSADVVRSPGQQGSKEVPATKDQYEKTEKRFENILKNIGKLSDSRRVVRNGGAENVYETVSLNIGGNEYETTSIKTICRMSNPNNSNKLCRDPFRMSLIPVARRIVMKNKKDNVYGVFEIDGDKVKFKLYDSSPQPKPKVKKVAVDRKPKEPKNPWAGGGQPHVLVNVVILFESCALTVGSRFFKLSVFPLRLV